MKLKYSLLMDIITSSELPNKCSKGFLNLKTIFELEQQEGFEMPKQITEKYLLLKEKYYNFINGIPLNVIERYYIKNLGDFNKYIYIEYQNNEVCEDYRVIDIYQLLEEFFSELFIIASMIANFYNIEVKINDTTFKKNRDFV